MSPVGAEARPVQIAKGVARRPNSIAEWATASLERSLSAIEDLSMGANRQSAKATPASAKAPTTSSVATTWRVFDEIIAPHPHTYLQGIHGRTIAIVLRSILAEGHLPVKAQLMAVFAQRFDWIQWLQS